MTNNATGSGMGTSGLVGQIMTYQTMVETEITGAGNSENCIVPLPTSGTVIYVI